MSLSGKQWIWPGDDDGKADELARSSDIPPALARLLINRGIDNPAQTREFLSPSKDQLHSPWLMAGMEQAVERLLCALENGEKIVIHGDYDADGITATVILVEALSRLGGQVDYFLPSRFAEGYGLHIEPLKKFKKTGVSLVVTVDCGINATEEIICAAELGLDLIITDHHQPLEEVNGALAVINPLQKKCSYPFKELSGAGIAFKLAAALMEKSGSPFPEDLLDLAALGTAADVVPLLGENRVIVSSGLNILRNLERPGFKALAEAVGLDQDRINSTALSFILAPAVNAAGRMGEALPAARLLLETDPEKAAGLAGQLHRANLLRRSTEQVILREAEAGALKQLAEEDSKVITLASENWHHGVIGIVASRLVELFNRPVALVALEDGEGRGSARSIPGFDITAALASSSELLERFGGHEQAAGFTIDAGRIAELRECLNRYAESELGDREPGLPLYIEAELEEPEISFDLSTMLEQLQPYGTANPVPLFGSRGWEIISWRLVGADRKHLKLTVRKESRILEPIIFSGAAFEPQLEKGRRVDLVFKLKNGFFRNRETLDLEVKDISYSDTASIGNLDLVDRRSSENRLALLKDILEKEETRSVLFAASQARAEKISKSYSIQNPPFIITSGAVNSGPESPEKFETLILFDLPLHESVLKAVLKKGLLNGRLKIYLLYNREDLKQNCLLTDLSLPSKELLEIINSALAGAVGSGSVPDFPGPAANSLGFKPAQSFWKRAESIFTEIGLLENGSLAKGYSELNVNWPECLDSSPTYLATRDLLESCEQFQRLLLEGTPKEIALYLQKQADC